MLLAEMIENEKPDEATKYFKKASEAFTKANELSFDLIIKLRSKFLNVCSNPHLRLKVGQKAINLRKEH
ncbi:hypothetical protein [Aliifodinibius sp. S!AR15-10]|uniref:hypothetical protein n=1 Tax=Aliifodinibius sp. S!AR15-10 TaxID=2950437 RepID=UPI0028704607|nr:hypothetical protein [Aliifodinibius sp. S!AR15-10]